MKPPNRRQANEDDDRDLRHLRLAVGRLQLAEEALAAGVTVCSVRSGIDLDRALRESQVLLLSLIHI